MIYSPFLWGRSQTAAELDGGADAANMLAARSSTLPGSTLHPYIAAAVPAVLAAAGAPAVAAAAAGAVMSAASAPAPAPAPSSGDRCGVCTSKATALASQVATEQQVSGGTVAAQIVPPAPIAGIPWWWWLVLAIAIGAVVLSPSKR